MSHETGEKVVRTLEVKDYTFHLKETGSSLFLYYTPETAKIGGYSALEAWKVIKKLELTPVSMGGLGPGQTAFKKAKQFWEFSPVPDKATITLLKSEIEDLLKHDIIVNNLLN